MIVLKHQNDRERNITKTHHLDFKNIRFGRISSTFFFKEINITDAFKTTFVSIQTYIFLPHIPEKTAISWVDSIFPFRIYIFTTYACVVFLCVKVCIYCVMWTISSSNLLCSILFLKMCLYEFARFHYMNSVSLYCCTEFINKKWAQFT